MKKCPYCAEEIQDEAIVCRYCGRDLVNPDEPKTGQKPKANVIQVEIDQLTNLRNAKQKALDSASTQRTIGLLGILIGIIVAIFFGITGLFFGGVFALAGILATLTQAAKVSNLKSQVDEINGKIQDRITALSQS